MKRTILILLAFMPLFVGAQNYLLRQGSNITSFQGSLTSAEVPKGRAVLINMFGQSNIDGNALISGLTGNLAKYTGEQNVYIFDSTNFNKVNSDINNNQFPVRQQDGNFGPELSMSYILDSLDVEVYINKYAIGGTYLYQHPSLTDWNVNSVGQLYDALKATRNRAYAALGDRPITEYVIWYQGEKDASSLVASNEYAANLEQFIDSVNTITDSCKFYCVRIHKDLSNISYEYHDTIRGSQFEVFQNHTNTELVTVDNYILQADSIHLDVQSQVDLGRKLAFRIESDFTPETEAVDLLARMPDATLNLRTRIITAFDSINYHGLTDSIYTLYAFNTEQQSYARMNWMNDNYTITELNAPQWDVDSGYSFSAASSQYLNTGFNPTTYGAFDLNNVSFGIYSNRTVGAALYSDIGVSDGGSQRIYLASYYNNNIYAFMSTTSTSGANNTDLGLFSASKKNDDVSIYRDNSIIVTGTRTDEVLINADLYIGALNTSGVASQFSNRSYSYMWLGKFHQVPTFYRIMNAYLYDKLIF